MTDDRYPHAKVHFGVFVQGVNHTTIWSDKDSGSQIDFATFREIAQTAERGLFDAFFLGEGLRLREQRGQIHELDIAGRPDAITELAALAGITSRIGLVATQNCTYNEPADLARRLSGLDLLSDGRAGWNAVTTDNAWTGENFRRGGYLDHQFRYDRARQFVQLAKQIWSGWTEDGGKEVEFRSSQFDVRLVPSLPPSPQGRPVIFQAGDSSTGRDFAAAEADVIFSAHGSDHAAALAFADDIRGRLRSFGRPEDDIKILPATQVVLAEREDEVAEKFDWVTRGQVTGQTALAMVSQVWGKDLSRLDPDGPLPEEDPVIAETSQTMGSGQGGKDPLAVAAGWRALAEEKGGLSIRELIVETTTQRRAGFVGTAAQVADRMAHFVRSGACHGFNISPYIVPGGLDEIVDWLVPALQERGVYRTAYEGTTLREHLGLRPVSPE